MQKLMWYLPLLLGSILVIQTGLNEQMQQHISFAHTLLINNLVFISLTCILLFIQYNYQELLPTQFNPGKPLIIKWWFIIPGIFGALYVAGNILSFGTVGAAHTTILVVIAQLIISILWDYFMKNQSLEWKQVFGAVLTMIGACFILIKK